MSRFIEFASCCKNQCAWKCCASENNKINVQKFGHNVRTQLNVYDSVPLISERSVYLDESNTTILKIGCSPQFFFEVIARMEFKTKNSVKLTSDELADFMTFLSENFDANNTWKIKNDKQTSPMKFVIDMKQTEPRAFSVRIGRKYLTIDENVMKEMLRKKSYIEHYISSLKEMKKSYGLMLFNLASHFCNEKKSLVYATSLARSKFYVHHFFDEIIDCHADCVDKAFVIEVGSNFAKWFSKCVPIFIETKMYNEADRIETFLCREWPHEKKYINVKKLAKSGLYYTGERDVVACAFCHVQLHEWLSDDNPILDHFKYAPKCPFLCHPKSSLNVPVGDVDKIEEMFSIIPKNNTYDEPDLRI